MDLPAPLATFRIRRDALVRLCKIFHHAGKLAVATLRGDGSTLALTTCGNGFAARSARSLDDGEGQPQRPLGVMVAHLERLATRISVEWITFEEYPAELIVRDGRDVCTLPTHDPEEHAWHSSSAIPSPASCDAKDLARTIRAGMVGAAGRSIRGDKRFRGIRLATDGSSLFAFSTTGREGLEARCECAGGTVDVTLPPQLAIALVGLAAAADPGNVELGCEPGTLIVRAGLTIARLETLQASLPDHRHLIIAPDQHSVQITVEAAALQDAFRRLDVECDTTRTMVSVVDGQLVLRRNGRAARVSVVGASVAGPRRAKVTIPTSEMNRWLSLLKPKAMVTLGFTPTRAGQRVRVATFESSSCTYIAAPGLYPRG